MAGSGYFRIQGADGQPIEVPASQFYFNTKARCRRMMLNSLSGEARQVYAALELGTMGFQQEKAVMSRNGVTRRMTPGDITTMTGLDKGSVRRALVELEGAGLAERRPVDASLPLQKGNVEIYSWAEPRPAQEVKRWARAPTIPDWVPESWDTLPLHSASTPSLPLAERTPVDSSLPLQKGNVEIYSWAEPRPAQEVKRWARAPTIPDWVPESWDTLPFPSASTPSLPPRFK